MLRLLLLLKHQYLGGITERKMLLVSYQTLSNMFVYKKMGFDRFDHENT
jgi:hypothetical protein